MSKNHLLTIVQERIVAVGQCWKARRYCLQVFVRGQRQIFPHLAGPAWIANQWSFFNQPPPWKWYLQWTLAISQASFSENCKFNVILEMTTDSVEQNDSFYMFWQNETFYMFCECWLVFEYSLKPGINIRNIWLTRPQLASHKLPEQNVAKFQTCRMNKLFQSKPHVKNLHPQSPRPPPYI